MNGKLKIEMLKKRCQRCEEFFEVPNIRQSIARVLVIQFHPCPHCYYVQDLPTSAMTGRCRLCSVPFAIVDHYALGYCQRDYMRRYRTITKN